MDILDKSSRSRGRCQQVVVAADGSAADLNTVQGALDWAPINPSNWPTILVMDGAYGELVYFQYKTKVLIRGQSQNGTRLGYAQPPKPLPTTRFLFQGRLGRAALQLQHHQLLPGTGRVPPDDGMRVVNGSGDAVTTYGTAYIRDTTLYGDGDTILGYGSVFWENCTISTGSAMS